MSGAAARRARGAGALARGHEAPAVLLPRGGGEGLRQGLQGAGHSHG